jgi:hypothetical protein
MAFGKRKKPPKKKVVDRSKHVRALTSEWKLRNGLKGWGYLLKPKK